MSDIRSHPLSKTLPLSLLAWLMLAITGLVGWLGAWPQFSWCMFKSVTHLPCALCGMTRSFVLISQGRFMESLDYHPLGIPVYAATFVIAAFGLVRPTLTWTLLMRLTQRPTVFVLLSLLAMVWIWKLTRPAAFW